MQLTTQPARAAVVDTAEIATMLGLSREHVTDRLTKRPDFPRPAINISRRTRMWRRADVLAFAVARRAGRVRYAR